MVLPAAHSADSRAGARGFAGAFAGRNRMAVYEPPNVSAATACGLRLEPASALCGLGCGHCAALLSVPLVCGAEVEEEEQVVELFVEALPGNNLTADKR